MCLDEVAEYQKCIHEYAPIDSVFEQVEHPLEFVHVVALVDVCQHSVDFAIYDSNCTVFSQKEWIHVDLVISHQRLFQEDCLRQNVFDDVDVSEVIGYECLQVINKLTLVEGHSK
ncbi:hypothetical protein ECANGB1_1930 [Enterospora canceri]|uniref:Uncharacterized protein n=1 Tax=Enterospora canceri TaxID=1081671 RepID=A0A1Y1S606_9MICR|nr:hypothetical protein ECANGB1_1930 [Enterospora canceri]